jgi:hypothetical protein
MIRDAAAAGHRQGGSMKDLNEFEARYACAEHGVTACNECGAAQPEPTELERIRQIVLALCEEPEDEGINFVILNENGDPIVEAETLPEAIEQIISCWNAVDEKYWNLRGPRPSEPGRTEAEPTETEIVAALASLNAEPQAEAFVAITGGAMSRALQAARRARP